MDILTTIKAAAIAVIAATPALAQQSRNCGPRDLVVERLAEAYGETRQMMGLGANGALIEVFAAGEDGSWTITVTTAQGVTCLVASGSNFVDISEALPPQGDPA